MDNAVDAVGAVARRKATSLREIVQSEIERMILAGDLDSGQRVNEQQIARRLGVSRGPVREALRALERAGLVNGVANVGTFVRQVGLDEAVELYELRGVIFGFACGRLAECCTAEQQQALQDLVSRMDAAISAYDAARYYDLNLRFHDLAMEFAAHNRAARIYDSLVKEGLLLRERSLRAVAAMAESNNEHKAILAAIMSGDAQTARAEAERHHRHGKRRWMDTLQR